jgi:putative glutathione S-transferase
VTAVLPLFEALDNIENMLKGKTYLIGNRLTEADIRLFVTIVSNHRHRSFTQRSDRFGGHQIRFDPVYVGHFKCNIRTIRYGYPNIYLQVAYTCSLCPLLCSPVHFDFQLVA